MLRFRAPTDAFILEYLARQAHLPLSYDRVGCTQSGPLAHNSGCNAPPVRRGWKIDSHRVLLGHGDDVFLHACRAIDTWQMFPSQMATVYGRETPHAGLSVAVVYRVMWLPIWLTMPARVVYTIDENIDRGGHAVERHGFAYGTLSDHPERGEERFLVEWDRQTDAVHYDLLAVSQPAHWFARLGYPYARLEQSRFRRLSGLAMQRAITADDPTTSQP